MPPDSSASQRPGGWPEPPPDRPKAPQASSFTPTVRSFAEAAPPREQPRPRPAPQPARGSEQPRPAPPAQRPRQADDPYKPFVTAGQISGPKTPPAHRQQELWNTVFGEGPEAIDDYDDDERGRPVWLFALVGSVVVALIAGLVWAFTAGPLSSPAEGDTGNAPRASASAKPSASANAAKPQSRIPPLPTYQGKRSPVAGVLTDRAAHLTLPRLGGPWRLDQNVQSVRAKYGYTTRQYVPAGMTAQGEPEFAQVMSGPLAQSLAARYTSPDSLGSLVSAVMYRARQSLFPAGNKTTKVAQQRVSRGGLTGLLAIYRVTADRAQTTVMVAVVDTGDQTPAVVYMSVPERKKELLPDINTVARSIKALR